eukprot:8551515-Alexandrium_andersonii.AAC.1
MNANAGAQTNAWTNDHRCTSLRASACFKPLETWLPMTFEQHCPKHALTDENAQPGNERTLIDAA